MGSLFEAALSAHYNIVALRAERGDPGFEKWRDLHNRVRQFSGGGPLFSRILPPERALQVLQDHHERSGKNALLHYEALHANAAWGLYNHLHLRLKKKPHPGVHDHLHQTLHQTAAVPAHRHRWHLKVPIDDELLLAENSDATLDDIFVFFLQRLAPKAKIYAFGIEECRLKDGVSMFKARVVAKCADELAHIATLADPRNWSRFYPNIWTKSYRISRRTQAGFSPSYRDLCNDRYLDPDPVDGDPPGGDYPRQPTKYGSWSGLFFEKAEIDLQNVPVLRGSTVLNIDFNVRRVSAKPTKTKRARKKDAFDKGTVTTTYSLHEALSSSVLCFVSPSGPDVDSGLDEPGAGSGFNIIRLNFRGGNLNDFAKRHARRKSDHVAEPFIDITAGKHLRFGDETYFSEEQNAFALPLWSTAITAGLVKSLTFGKDYGTRGGP